eukprot:14403821-Alexandrium_andersonii.AAC.1
MWEGRGMEAAPAQGPGPHRSTPNLYEAARQRAPASCVCAWGTALGLLRSTPRPSTAAARRHPCGGGRGEAVSYTHLTLPTICSV